MSARFGGFIVFTIVLAVIFSSCASSPLRAVRDAGKPQKQKTEYQLKLEQEEETRALVIKATTSFVVMTVGGLVGLLSSSKGDEVKSTLVGCGIGLAGGFFLGMAIYENSPKPDPKGDDEKMKRYFEEYRNIQLK
ncbi:MAG TPA: hypothetical protein P5511_06530 [Candidatus Goldiibacteriota bacterium]|mgnify:CR=1 FL=1|nr:hypothetical protein [Candidatus Goldiibacteriota bacterium]